MHVTIYMIRRSFQVTLEELRPGDSPDGLTLGVTTTAPDDLDESPATAEHIPETWPAHQVLSNKTHTHIYIHRSCAHTHIYICICICICLYVCMYT